MAQTKNGALKCSAKAAGITIAEFKERLAAGLKKCTCCKEWKPVGDFGNDGTRSDGKNSSCFACRRVEKRISTKGRESTFKGRKHSKEAKEKMSAAKSSLPSKRKGIPRSLDEKIKISASLRASERTLRGKSCPSYKDGKLVERRDQRFSTAYKRWRFDVFARDKFTCQLCGDDSGGNLRAHHKWSFADYPELRLDINNGITLCDTCHKSEHSKQVSVSSEISSEVLVWA